MHLLGRLEPFALLALRLFAGLAMAFQHGYGKVFLGKTAGLTTRVAEWGWPLPSLFAWSAGLAEFVGGLALAVGFLVRPLAPFTAMTMLVAAFVAHAGDPFGKRELALLYAFVFLFFAVRGPGPLSLDEWLASRRRIRSE